MTCTAITPSSTGALQRHGANPIITPDQIAPSHSAFRVRGAFNPGAAVVGDEIVLLLRVAEDDPAREERAAHPTSHLRVARSLDGVRFTVEDQPFLTPELGYEIGGVEDARITPMGDRYVVTYTAVSDDGRATGLLETFDFVEFDRLGLIFHPENQDVSIFPGRDGGLYRALHRPTAANGASAIWFAESPDLLHWGNHHCVVRPDDVNWSATSIGGGAPSIRTEHGWLQIAHATSPGQASSLWALLLDDHDPTRVLAHGTEPLLAAETSRELGGTNPGLLSNGVIERDGELFVYYGAAGHTTCLATTTVDEVLDSLR